MGRYFPCNIWIDIGLVLLLGLIAILQIVNIFLAIVAKDITVIDRRPDSEAEPG